MSGADHETLSHWLTAFDASLRAGDVGTARSLFVDHGFWRDRVAFTWTIATVEGAEAIGAMLEAQLGTVRPTDWTIDGRVTRNGDTIEALIRFETAAGRGRGLVRLRDGRCLTLLTTLVDLKGHEEPTGRRRERGTVHGAFRDRETWRERRDREAASLGRDVQPYCVIVGGGQGGIALAARLKRLGVPTIILEQLARPGDTWRNRYRTLVLHDPVWYDHMPYMPFPDHWPVFTPKDKFGDWLEMYVRVMELDYWASSECLGASYDESTDTWSVTVRRGGEEIELHPRQLVFATGAYGPPSRPDFAGESAFDGTVIHSSDYADGAPYAGKRCVVIGTGSSAHDIAADLWENEASVTMVQRSPTIVVRSETLMSFAFGSLYSEAAVERGITTDIADILFDSVPFRLAVESQRKMYEAIHKHDAAYYERLAASGFRYDFGEDGTGLLMRALRTASGYYIDVGASDLIARGEIAIRSGVAVTDIDADGVVLDDGARLPADLVVCATGFRTMDEQVARLVSRDVANRIGRAWGIGSGVRGDPGPWVGELRNLYQPTAQPGLWLHGGNLALSRYFSLFLALQIKARMEGIATPVYQPATEEVAA